MGYNGPAPHRPVDAIRPAASCPGPDNPHLTPEENRGAAGRAVASASYAVIAERRKLGDFSEQYRAAIVWEVSQLKRLLRAAEPEWWGRLRPGELELFAGEPGFPPRGWSAGA